METLEDTGGPASDGLHIQRKLAPPGRAPENQGRRDAPIYRSKLARGLLCT